MAGQAIAEAFVDINARTGGLDKGLLATKAKLAGLGTAGKSAGMGITAAFGPVIAAIAAISVVLKGAGSAVSAYSNSMETASKFNVVFGNEAAKTREELTAFADKFGIAQREVEGTASSFQDILVPLGASRKEAAKFSVDMTKLTGDLASFNDQPTADVARKIKAALTGETEGMKSLGVVLNQTEVKQKAMAMTGKKLESQITKIEKAEATMALITEQSADAQGDLERTYLSLANQMKAVGGNFDNLKVVMGDAINQIFGVEDGVLALNKTLISLKTRISEALETAEFQKFAAVVRYIFKEIWINLKTPFVLLKALVVDIFTYLAEPIKAFFKVVGKLSVGMMEMFAELENSLGKSFEKVLPETGKAMQKLAQERKDNLAGLKKDWAEAGQTEKDISKDTADETAKNEAAKQKAIKETIGITSGFEAISKLAQDAFSKVTGGTGSSGASTVSNSSGSVGVSGSNSADSSTFSLMLKALQSIDSNIQSIVDQPRAIIV